MLIAVESSLETFDGFTLGFVVASLSRVNRLRPEPKQVSDQGSATHDSYIICSLVLDKEPSYR